MTDSPEPPVEEADIRIRPGRWLSQDLVHRARRNVFVETAGVDIDVHPHHEALPEPFSHEDYASGAQALADLLTAAAMISLTIGVKRDDHRALALETYDAAARAVERAEARKEAGHG